MIDVFRVSRPGPYTTVQDKGRYGYQQYGVPPTGALDQFAYRVANLLVGNPQGSAVLELTVFGPALEVLADAAIAITGADMPIRLNDDPVETWTCFKIKSGDRLDIGLVRSGCRGYLAVTGGIDVPVVMGSRSTYVGAKVGGYAGRILATGDVISCGEGTPMRVPLQLPQKFIPRYAPEIDLRAIPGPQNDFFDQGLTTLFSSEFTVDTHSNRMGYRLKGPKVAQRAGMPKSIISEPTLSGGIQVPADGQPIIVLVEQTAGGYTKIATVISADIPLIAQAKPGDRIRFKQVDLKTAHAAFRRQEQIIAEIKTHLAGNRCSPK
jgi:biotin-dependent carboxylase-like uncharacterized protein